MLEQLIEFEKVSPKFMERAPEKLQPILFSLNRKPQVHDDDQKSCLPKIHDRFKHDKSLRFSSKSQIVLNKDSVKQLEK